MSRYRKIAITLPEETLREVEARRRVTGETRSAILRRALGLLLGGPDRIADGVARYVASSGPSTGRSAEERLEIFDAATRRLAERPRPAVAAPPERDRKREDLYDRGRPD